MKTFNIEYKYERDLQHRRYETTVEAWDKEHAKLIFAEDNPGSLLISCYEKDEP